MKIFEGLYLHEIVLLLLGVIMFCVLVVLLIVFVIQRRGIKPLLLFFVIPILMIGFPAISKVKFDKDGVEIDKATEAAAEDPSSAAVRAKLENLVEQTKPRLAQSPEGLVKIARAEAVLGDQNKALRTLDQALNRDPKLETAKDLKTKLETVEPTNKAAVRRAVQSNIAGGREVSPHY
jgi:hypothetical protein